MSNDTKPKGEVTIMGGSLAVPFPGRHWSLMLRQKDNLSHSGFFEHHRCEVTPGIIAEFLPHWRTLRWRPRARNLPGFVACSATDDEFWIGLLAGVGSSLTSEQMVGEFNQYMAEVALDA